MNDAELALLSEIASSEPWYPVDCGNRVACTFCTTNSIVPSRLKYAPRHREWCLWRRAVELMVGQEDQ